MKFFSVIATSLVVMGLCSACGKPPGVVSATSNDINGAVSAADATFSAVQSKILNPKCIKCHSGAYPKKGIDLSSYDSIMNSPSRPTLVIPGDPENSNLYREVVTGDMPDEGAPLNTEELQLVYTWIKNGAKKDDAGTGAAGADALTSGCTAVVAPDGQVSMNCPADGTTD